MLNKSGVLARAIQAVSEEARWEAFDLLSRRGAEAAPELLRGRSGELAVSPAGRDQLLSLALDQTAASIQRGGKMPMSDLATLLVLHPLSDAAAARVQAEAERLIQSEASAVSQYALDVVRSAEGSPGATSLPSDLLYEQARLNEVCWREARLPAEWPIRALMLASIPSLEAAARVRRRPSFLSRLFRQCRIFPPDKLEGSAS